MVGLTADERARVAEVARAWLDTPFHADAMRKGVGVDCGRLLLAVYIEAGIIAPSAARTLDAPHAPLGLHLHQGDDRYLRIIERFATPVVRPWQVGDVFLFRGPRWPSFGHGAILVSQSSVVHAIAPRVVEWPLASSWFRASTVRALRVVR